MPVPPRHRIGVMVVLASVTLATIGAPANGQQIDDKKAEAAAIASKLNEQAARIVESDIRLRAAQDELEDAETGVASAEAELAATVRRQVELKRQLVVQAQDAYVVGGSVSVLRYLVNTTGDEVVRRAYLRIVSGHDRKLLGELRAAREDLEDLRERLQSARRRAQEKATALSEDRVDLDRAIRSQRAVLQQVNGELAQLIAAEQARRDAEAARELAARKPVAQAPAVAAAFAAPAPTAAPLAIITAPVSDTWACIRQLESGNNYSSPGGGAYQFLDSTWQSLGYTGTASDAPPAVQDEAAVKLQARDGWSQWTTAPLCGRT